MLSGCTYPFEDYLPQSSAVTTNDTGAEVHDSAVVDTRVPDASVRDTSTEDTFVEDTFEPDTYVPDTFVPTDTGSTCTCLFWAGPNCKQWSPPGCGP